MKTKMILLTLLITVQVVFGQDPTLWTKEITHYDFITIGNNLFAHEENNMVAYNLNSAEKVWEVPSPLSSNKQKHMFTDKERIFCFGYSSSGGERFVIALDAKTGTELWRFKHPEVWGDLFFSGIIHDLFIYSGQDKVYGLNIETGKKILAISKTSSPASAFDDLIFVANYKYVKNGSNKYWINTYNYEGNELGNNIILSDTNFTSVTYCDKDIAIYQSDIKGWNYPYFIDRSTNKILWEGNRFASYLHQGDLIIETGPTWVSGKKLNTGQEIWKYELTDAIKSAIGTDKSLLVCTKTGSIIKLDELTGKEIWKGNVPGSILDFDVSGQLLAISSGIYGEHENDNIKSSLTVMDISKMTHEGFIAQEKMRIEQELQAQRAEENKKRIEYQKANTYLTINNGGHISLIRKMVVTNDGKYIVTAGDDKVIYIRNAKTGDIVDALYGQIGEGSEGKIYAMALSPDNKYLAVAGFFSSQTDLSGRIGAIRLYDFPGRKLLGLLQQGKSDVVTSLAFSEDSKHLVSAAGTNIKVWSTDDQKFVRTFKDEHGVPIYNIAINKNKIVSSAFDRKIVLWDMNSDNFQKLDSTHIVEGICVNISPDGTTIASAGNDNKLIIYDNNLNVIQILENDNSPACLEFSPDGKKILLGCDGDPQVSNLFEFNGTQWAKIASYNGLQAGATLTTAFLDNNTAVCAGGNNYEIAIWTWLKNAAANPVTIKELQRFSGKGNPVYGVGFSNNQVFFTNAPSTDFTQSVLTNSFDLFCNKITIDAKIPSDVERAVTSKGEYSLKAITFKEPGTFVDPPENNSLSVMKNGSEYFKIFKESFEGSIHHSYTFTKNNYIVSGGSNGVMIAYDLDGKIISRFVGHRDLINDVFPTADGKFLISCSNDQTIKFWDPAEIGKENASVPAPTEVADPMFMGYYEQRNLMEESNEKSISAWEAIIQDMRSVDFDDYADYFQKTLNYYSAGTINPVATLYIDTNNEWILWSEDGYFTSSKYGGKYIGYHINQGYDKAAKYYPFEQFDLKFNRPDIMLARVGINDDMLSKAYYSAYKKRLTKMGLTEDAISDDIHLPEIVLQSRSQETGSKNIQVEFDAKDDTYLIDRVNILINDVPMYGSKGFSVRNLKQQSVHEKFNVELTKGKNKIQVSAMNEKGAESMKETYYVTCNDPSPVVKNRYVVAIGVSDYANNEYDLKYAAKDAGDLAKLLEMNKGEFANTKVLRILDTVATRENIQKAKQFLMQSKVGDQVILFVAGHGLLDDKLDWYFATTDVDFNNPAAMGLAYSELEGLLDSIPSRNKLMLMDACNSGEVDKEDAELVANNSQSVAGVKSRGFKNVASKSQSLGLQNSFQLMQNLFSDISNGTGTTVISSASGAEFAYESAAWNNGVFTFSMLEGLKTGNADKNKDGKIVVSELRDYIAGKVSSLTQGKQNPTSRKENLEFDFRVW